MWFVKLALIVGAIYAGVLLLMYLQQTRMLFPTHMAAAAGTVLPPSARELEVATDGQRLYGLHIPPAENGAGERSLIVGFGGNAWNANNVAVYLHALFPGNDVVAFHYRGYRPSSGAPSAKALLEDAPLVVDHAVEEVGSDRVVAVGFSIGAAVAAHVASQRQLEGLILVTPFDSLRALAREHFPWAPVSWFLRHRMDPEKSLRDSITPTAVIAAERDTIVPPRRTEALRRAIPTLVFDRTVASAGHNDLYERAEFQSAMVEALEKIRSAVRKGPTNAP